MRAIRGEESARPPVPPAGELAGVALLGGLGEDERSRVLDRADTLTVDVGDRIISQGDHDRAMFVLLSGAAVVEVAAGEADAIEVGTIGAGDAFGELTALLGEPRSATVTATAPSRLLRLSGEAIEELVEAGGDFGVALTRDLARGLRDTLEEHNAQEVEATPDRVLVPAQDVARSRSYLAQHHLATVRGMLNRNRLLQAGSPPRYSTELPASPQERERWDALFGVSDETLRPPLTCHTTAWTVLLMRLLDAAGVNFRELSHGRTRLSLHRGEGWAPEVANRLDLQIVGAAPVDGDRVELLVETALTRPPDQRVLTALDRFEVAGPDRAHLPRSAAEGWQAGADQWPAIETAMPSIPDSDAIVVGLYLPDDLGARFGRLSGNLHPVHTSAAAARLWGHRRPLVQHMCLLNLALVHLTRVLGRPPQGLDLVFTRPVLSGQTVELRVDGQRLEILDSEGELVLAGAHEPAETTARPADTTLADGRRLPAPTAGVAQSAHAVERDAPEAEAAPGPAADPVALQRLLDGDHAELRERVREILSQPRLAYVSELPRDVYRDHVLELCRHLAAEDLGWLAFPAEFGGSDDPTAMIVVFEMLAYGDLSVPVKLGVQFGLFGGAVLHLGSEGQHRQWLPRIRTFDLPGCFALTETGHGSNVRGIRTTATYDRAAEEFVVETPDDDARKDYIGGAARHARLAVVFAQLEVAGRREGIHALLVPIRDADGTVLPGVHIEDCGEKLGLNGVDNGRLRFAGVRVPRAALLNRYGNVSVDGVYSSPIEDPSARFFTMLSTLVTGRISVALAATSTTKSALTIAVRYGLRRRQFGPQDAPETLLMDYPSHQRRLLPPLATAYVHSMALTALAEEYAEVLGEPGDSRRRKQVESHAAGMKALATWQANTTIQACREACGGQGYLAENRFAALKADSDVLTTFEGDNTVLLQLVAKTLLTGYRQQFDDMNLAGLMRYVLQSILSSAVPTLASRRSDTEHLRDRGFHVEALRSREEILIADLARALKRDLDRGQVPHEAFNNAQTRALETAAAHVERVTLEQAGAVVDRRCDPSQRDVLDRLLALHALSGLERHRAWYLEQRMFTPGKAQGIRAQIDALCSELRPIAGELVDGFSIHDRVLAAPIAVKNGAPT